MYIQFSYLSIKEIPEFKIVVQRATDDLATVKGQIQASHSIVMTCQCH